MLTGRQLQPLECCPVCSTTARARKIVGPDTNAETKSVLADEDHDLASLPLHVFLERTGDAIIDILRVQDGKVVEHWGYGKGRETAPVEN